VSTGVEAIRLYLYLSFVAVVRVGDPSPDTGRPGTLTSRNVDPGGRTVRARSATATLS
jgi:hypothetical protein